MGGGASKDSKAKVQAVNAFSSAGNTNNNRSDSEVPPLQLQQTGRQSQRRGRRQRAEEDEKEGEAEIKTVRAPKTERVKSSKPPIEKPPKGEQCPEIDFTNTSSQTVYVYLSIRNEDKCFGEIGPESSVLMAVPSGHPFQVRDLFNDVYFKGVTNCHKICVIASSPITSAKDKSAVRIFNTSSNQAIVKEVVTDDVRGRHPKQVVLVSAKGDMFLQPRQGVTYRIQTERGHNKFEVMSSSMPQSYIINKNFSDIGAIVSPYPPYVEASFLGFLIVAPEKLLDKKKHPKLFAALEQDLREIKRILPRSVVGLMQRVALYLNEDSEPCVTGLCFHRDRSWLGMNVEPFEKYCAVEVRNAEEYLTTRQKAPACLLHEYAHAYLFFTEKTNLPLVKYSYEETIQKGQYMSLSLKRPHYSITGPKMLKRSGTTYHYWSRGLFWVSRSPTSGDRKEEGRPSRTTNDCEEYFAESTVSFFSSVLFFAPEYPKNCSDLWAFDPTGFEMCEKVYNVVGQQRKKQYFEEIKQSKQN